MFIRSTNHSLRNTALTGALAASLFTFTGCAGDTDEADGVDDVVTDESGDIGNLDDTATDTGDEPGVEGVADGERTLAELMGELDDYIGEPVTVAAEVEEVLSDQAFTLAADENNSMEPLLVVSAETGQVDEGADVIVTGTLQESFTVTEAEGELGTDLDDDLFATWREDYYLVGTAVNPDDPDGDEDGEAFDEVDLDDDGVQPDEAA